MAPRRYFFRATDGSLIGPVNLNSVAEMIRSGKVKANTPISLDGQDFRPMKSYPELATLLSVDVDLPDASEGDDLFESPPTYSGDLTAVSVPKLLYHFTAAKANGRLLLSNQSVRKELFLVNGKPVAARSNLERDLLSQHLVRSGVVQKLDMQKMLQELGGKEDRLSDLLIQRRLLPPHQLFEQLKQQLLEKIQEVFGWRIGTYAFYDGQEFKGTLLPLNLNPWEVIAEGVRKGYELVELRALLEPLRNRILIPRENQHVHVTKLILHPRELKVFKSISAGRTLGGILDRLGGSEEEDRLVLAMIYMGIEMELVGIGDEIVAAPMSDLEEWDQTGGQGDEWDAMLGKGLSSASAPAAPKPVAPDSPIQATPTMSRQEQNLLEQLNELKTKNFFDRLGLQTTASGKDATVAFMQVAKSYHPDQIPQEASPRVRSLSSDIFALYNEAHQTLSDNRKRIEYAEAIEAGFEDGQVDISKIMESEMMFQKGEVLANAGRFAEAQDLFQKAIDLNPDEGEFFIYRGYATFFATQNPDTMARERCLQDIKKGLQMRDNNVANGFLFLGRIYKALGDLDTASKNFKKALGLEKNNLEASRELRLLSMRSKKKGLFKKK
jgi:tetratricopeptide (TPR) repeat protein